MRYTRVLPRDLFNESKLLKCMGSLVLKITDDLVPAPMSFRHVSFDQGFVIEQDQSEGDLYINNLTVFINFRLIHFYTKYNSKDNYPFYALDLSDDPVQVFDSNGNFTDEFNQFAKQL